jgi:glycosyltransferase involved in cell wall biosynthesis
VTPWLSIIVPTIGRPTLARALDSLTRQPLDPRDEVIVCGNGPNLPIVMEAWRGGWDQFRYIPCPTGGHFGCEERNHAMAAATGTHLLFLDDDDGYLPGALAAIRPVIERHFDRPILARMITATGALLWRDRIVRPGNQGTPQFICPNDPGKLGQWTERYQGDLDFLVSTLTHYGPKALVWDTTILAACRDYADRVWAEGFPAA